MDNFYYDHFYDAYSDHDLNTVRCGTFCAHHSSNFDFDFCTTAATFVKCGCTFAFTVKRCTITVSCACLIVFSPCSYSIGPCLLGAGLWQRSILFTIQRG